MKSTVAETLLHTYYLRLNAELSTRCRKAVILGRGFLPLGARVYAPAPPAGARCDWFFGHSRGPVVVAKCGLRKGARTSFPVGLI